MKEIKKRNLLSTISKCLQEHQVDLVGEQGIAHKYLIEVGDSGSLFADFMDTYNGEVDDFKKRLAEKTMKKESSDQIYGVLVNKDLKYEFAFNRQFADLDIKQQRITFKNVEDVLLEYNSNQDLSQIKDYERDFQGGRGSGSEKIVIKYAIVGKNRRKNHEENQGKIIYERPSLLDRIKTAYKKEVVYLDLGQNKIAPFFLINTSYETSRFDDFMKTYREGVDDFKKDLAKQLFGNKNVENRYGLLLTPDLQIQFAFNSQFGRYDEESKSIIYIPIEEVLLGQTKKQDIDLSSKKINPKENSRDFPHIDPFYPNYERFPKNGEGSSTIIRYALQGKKNRG